MKKMLNSIHIMGRFVKDPENRATSNGTPVCTFTLAVDDDYKSKDGEKTTQFIDCVAWQSLADFTAKYFTKGSLAVVTGRLQNRDWTDKNGNKRRNTEVVADHIYFGGSKTNNSANVSAEDFEEIQEDDGTLPF